MKAPERAAVQLGIRRHARYRKVAATQILEMLLHAGWAYEWRAGDRAPAAQEATETLERWIALGLANETGPDGQRYFDPAEVQNFFRWAAIHRDDRFWRDRLIATARRAIREFHAPDASEIPPPPTALSSRRFRVILRRDFNLRDRPPGELVRLRLPLPFEDDALRDLTVSHLPPLDTVGEVLRAPGRLDVKMAVPSERRVSLAIDMAFTAYPTNPDRRDAPLSARETALYTRAREGIVQVTPRIRALATELAGDLPTTTAVRRFWDFMLDRFTVGMIHYDELDPDCPTEWPLETKWADCQILSALLVALCRSRGIPARIVAGYRLYSVEATSHYWVEIWTDGTGWAPFDLHCFELSAGGREVPWRDYFAGCVDYRMKTQCLPLLFDAIPAIRFPPRWYMLQRAGDDGDEIGFHANDSGDLLYRDRITVVQPPRYGVTPADGRHPKTSRTRVTSSATKRQPSAVK